MMTPTASLVRVESQKETPMSPFRTTSRLLLVALAFAASAAWAQPNLPNVAKKAVGDFFSAVKNRVIADADKVDQWRNDATAAARKTATDFASCPSPDAQRLYDDMKSKRDKAQATQTQANQAVAAADAALQSCLSAWPDVPGGSLPSPCHATYTGLPFKGIRDAAQAAVDALNAAMNALKALKCIAGCNKTAGVDYPSCALAGVHGGGTVNVNVGGMTAAGLQGAATVNQNLSLGNGFDVCVEWDPGSFSPIWNPGPSGVQAGVDIRYPKCKRTVHVPGSICTAWDITLVLPKLRELKLVPPEVVAGELKIEVATQNISYVTVEQAPSCTKEVVLCTGISAGCFAPPPALHPADIAKAMGALCTDKTFVGCAQPAFGLVVVNKTASVPDPSQGTVTWKGPKLKAGSIKVDFTRPEFSIACRTHGAGPNTGGAPSVTCSNKHLDLPFICLEPRFASIVGNP